MTEPDRRTAAIRSAASDPLLKEVRWRLFRRDELPARLRRLERLEEVAFPAPAENGDAPEKPKGER